LGFLKQLDLSFTNCFPGPKVFRNFEKQVPAQVNQERKTINNNLILYNMAIPVLGKSLRSDWFFLGQDFAVRTVSMETVQPVYFCFGAKPANAKFATKSAGKKICEDCHSS